MSQRMEKLMYTIGMINKTNGPTSKVLANIDKISQRTRTGMQNVAVGSAGLFSTGYALKAMLGPAIEMDRALGELRSLNVQGHALNYLEKQALDFSMQYGESATEIVRASYKLQSSIQGLSNSDLGNIAFQSGVLAKATKGDFEKINAYTGQMFNIFQDKAALLGKSDFMAEVVDKTALAVQLFNTDGSQMVEAVKNIGKMAERAKIPLEEQLAVMGMLQNTMQMGARAGTSYASFLQSIGKAEGVLGISLTNQKGQALPIIDILEKIKGKYGDLSKASATTDLQKAFGSNGMKMVLALSGNIGMLKDNINSLIDPAQFKGKAAYMAEQIADPWEKASQAINAVSISFGRVLAPALYPVLDMIGKGSKTITRWTELFPNLTKYVSYTTLAVLGLVAAGGMLTLISGIATLATSGLLLVLMPLKAILLLIKAGFLSNIAAMILYNTWCISITAVSKALTAGMWLFNVALTANPIGLIVVAIAALVAGLVLAYKHFDDFKKLVDSGVDFMLNKFSWLSDGWNVIKGAVSFGVTESKAKQKTINEALPSLKAEVNSNTEPGGIINSLSNLNNNQRSTGDITINTTEKVNGFWLHDELAMAGG